MKILLAYKVSSAAIFSALMAYAAAHGVYLESNAASANCPQGSFIAQGNELRVELFTVAVASVPANLDAVPPAPLKAGHCPAEAVAVASTTVNSACSAQGSNCTKE